MCVPQITTSPRSRKIAATAGDKIEKKKKNETAGGKGMIQDGAFSPKAIISNCLRATVIMGRVRGTDKIQMPVS